MANEEELLAQADVQEESGPESGEKKGEKEPFNLKKELWEWAKALVVAGLIVFVIFHYLINVVTVNGSSMNPTLENQDRLVISHLFYTPAVGDIVILSEDTGLNEALVKRIVALPGQVVDINEEGLVVIDGKVLSEPYIAEPIAASRRGDQSYPVTVEEGTVFVMGDNRNHSTDSRFVEIGLVPEEEILGRVIFRLLPFNKMGAVH